MTNIDNIESLEDFKNSFFYGTRTDLNFKFLGALSAEDAGTFFQELLWKMGDTLNDGNLDRLIDHVTAWQQRGYDKPAKFVYEDGSFAPLVKPLAETRLGLLTSTGHFVDGDDPKPFGVENMSQEEAIAAMLKFLRSEPTLSKIPTDTPLERLRVRHGGYDVRGAMADSGVALPLTLLNDLAEAGTIGEFVSPAYSFVGAASQRRLLKQAAPSWVMLFQEQGIEAVVLVPV